MPIRQPNAQPEDRRSPKKGPVTGRVPQSGAADPAVKRPVETDEYLRAINPPDKARQPVFKEMAKQVLDLAENSPEEMSSLIHVWLAQGRQEGTGPASPDDDSEPESPATE